MGPFWVRRGFEKLEYTGRRPPYGATNKLNNTYNRVPLAA